MKGDCAETFGETTVFEYDPTQKLHERIAVVLNQTPLNFVRAANLCIPCVDKNTTWVKLDAVPQSYTDAVKATAKMTDIYLLFKERMFRQKMLKSILQRYIRPKPGFEDGWRDWAKNQNYDDYMPRLDKILHAVLIDVFYAELNEIFTEEIAEMDIRHRKNCDTK